jgi:hypothetical protein
MADAPFDPNGAVRFDLRSGAASDSKGARLVLVPTTALEGLSADVLEQIGAQIGRACGARIAGRLGGDSGVCGASVELVIAHLAGELAIAGIGAVHIERWGRALVAIVSNASLADDGFVGEVLAGAFSAASGRQISAAALGREGTQARYFLGTAATAGRVRDLVERGTGYAEVLATIQGASA